MTKDMTKGSLALSLISFGIPLILSGVLQQLYSWADAFIVGNTKGETELAAIGATTAMINVFIMAITGFTSGISILSARYFGQNNNSSQKNIIFTFLIVLGVTFTVISGVSILLADKFLVLLKTPSDIFVVSKVYLQIILTGIPFVTVYNVYSAVLRGIGDSRAPLYSVIASSLLNVILDIVFVAGFRTGAAGAAAASVISQAVMMIFIIIYTVRKYDFLRFGAEKIKIDIKVFREGSSLSVPIMIQSLINSAGNLVLQSFMNSFGTTTIAAITTAYRVDSIILLPIINLGTAVSTMTSQNIGAGETERTEKCLRTGVEITAAVSVVLSLTVFFSGGYLIKMFGASEMSVEIGRNFFRAISCFYTVFGIATAMRGYIEGTGKVVFSSLGGIASLALRIVLSYILKPFLGNMVIAYAEAVSWCFLSAVYGIWLYAKRNSLFKGNN